VTNASGGLLSQYRYLPFGQLRTDVPLPNSQSTNAQFTAFGYTGQRGLEASGLMDYKARFYDPSLNRFLQPDSIVPGAGNPQAWNRYTYALNSPIVFRDPSGHCVKASYSTKLVSDDACEKGVSLNDNLHVFGITTSGLNDKEKKKIINATEDIAIKFMATRGGSETDAFKAVYKNGLRFEKSGQTCKQANPTINGNCWGQTVGNVVTIYSNANVTSPNYNNFLVHEMGHAFDKGIGLALTIGYAGRVSDLTATPSMPTGNEGYACSVPLGSFCSWIQGEHLAGTGYDVDQTADMFLGWVYNTWGKDRRRGNWMNLWMPSLVTIGAGPSADSQSRCYEDTITGVGCP
jgi:RHS repeat-associated protein